MHFTLDENRVSGLCGDLQLKAAITRLSSNYFKREVEVCTTICQGNKNKNAQINAQKKCNACTKKIILTPTKVSGKKTITGKRSPTKGVHGSGLSMQLTRKFDLYPSLTHR